MISWFDAPDFDFVSFTSSSAPGQSANMCPGWNCIENKNTSICQINILFKKNLDKDVKKTIQKESKTKGGTMFQIHPTSNMFAFDE